MSSGIYPCLPCFVLLFTPQIPSAPKKSLSLCWEQPPCRYILGTLANQIAALGAAFSLTSTPPFFRDCNNATRNKTDFQGRTPWSTCRERSLKEARQFLVAMLMLTTQGGGPIRLALPRATNRLNMALEQYMGEYSWFNMYMYVHSWFVYNCSLNLMQEYLRRQVKPRNKDELVNGILQFWRTLTVARSTWINSSQKYSELKERPTIVYFSWGDRAEFHVGMECALFEYFGMGWGNAQFHYVITACAAVTFPCEKDAALSRRLKRVHWCSD